MVEESLSSSIPRPLSVLFIFDAFVSAGALDGFQYDGCAGLGFKQEYSCILVIFDWDELFP